MDWFLEVIIPMGPLLGISRLVGKGRARAFEMWILGLGRATLRATAELLLATLALLVTFLPYQTMTLLHEGLGGDSPSGARAVLLQFLWIGYGSMWSAYLAHRFLKGIVRSWLTRRTSAPPWPIDHGQRPFVWQPYFSAILLFDISLSIPFYALATFGALLGYLCLVPFILAEGIRARIAPDSTSSYFDLIAYVLSAIAFGAKVAT